MEWKDFEKDNRQELMLEYYSSYMSKDNFQNYLLRRLGEMPSHMPLVMLMDYAHEYVDEYEPGSYEEFVKGRFEEVE